MQGDRERFVLASGLVEELCNAVVSGVACALPEVIRALYGASPDATSSEFQRAAAPLDEFIQQLDSFPTPWALKWALQARGVLTATFSQPVTAHRQAQTEQMIAWMRQWLATTTQAREIAGR
jgi:4-hydroxy-tetrahydrodipicolinate synthase